MGQLIAPCLIKTSLWSMKILLRGSSTTLIFTSDLHVREIYDYVKDYILLITKYLGTQILMAMANMGAELVSHQAVSGKSIGIPKASM